MINKVILVGNIGKDPEVRHLEGGSVVANFPLATNENYKDKNGEWQKLTEWHDIVAWGSLAQYSEKWLKKGSLIYVEGKLTHRKYTDKDNIERYVTDVKAVVIRMMERRDGSDSNDTGTSTTSEPASSSGNISIQDQDDDDLPF